jgi:hypothetical protein
MEESSASVGLGSTGGFAHVSRNLGGYIKIYKKSTVPMHSIRVFGQCTENQHHHKHENEAVTTATIAVIARFLGVTVY